MSRIIEKLKKGIENPRVVIQLVLMSPLTRILPDKIDLKLLYRACIGKRLNLESPCTFTEKIQWLKLYDRKSIYTQMADKFAAKEYVAGIIGKEYIIPTYGVWDSFDDIDFESLPNQFVLKCTHDSGGIVICRDKCQLDICEARKVINRCLKRNMFWESREWVYKEIKPRIIAEKYIEATKEHALPDYKFFTFGGKVKALFVATDREKNNIETSFDFYDRDFHHIPVRNGHPNNPNGVIKPTRYDEMIELAEKLSKGTAHLRVDFYEVDGKIYFGELTFYHYSGLVPFDPSQYDELFGSWISIP